ncbi:unnamed protein product [Protopolystoma xenopodis]|uniref:Uncharacterized protein n=1 Tax=Protopolystoma xenopodis TaxID=117903 RepID=A0A448WNM6_9PLAT|nr:unnamed protein product [Protopolystoma xenopodis]
MTDSSVVRSRPDGTTRRARFLRSFSLSRRKTGQASVCAQETSRNRSSSPGRRVDPRKQGRTLPPGHEATGASGDSEKGCLPTNRSEAGRTSVADHQHPPNGQNPRARLTTTSASTIGCSRDRMPANRLERRNKRTPTPVAVTTNLVPPVKAPSPASRNRLSDFFLACRTNYRDRFPTNRRQATLMGTVVVDALSRGASQSCETKVGCRSPFSSTFSPSPSTSSAIARTVSNLLSDGSSGFALPSHSVLLSTPRDRFSTAFFTGSPGLPSRSCPTDFSEYIGHSAHLDMATLTRMLSDVSGESASRRTLSVCQKPAAETEACPSVQYGTVFYPLTPPQVTDQTGPWKPAWQQAVTRAATADSSVLLPSGHQTGPGPLEMHLIRSGQDRSFRPASYRSERTTSLLFPSNSERFHSSSQIKAAIPTGLARLEVARMDHSAQHLVSRRMSRLGRDQIYSNKTTACQQRPRSRKSASCPV